MLIKNELYPEFDKLLTKFYANNDEELLNFLETKCFYDLQSYAKSMPINYVMSNLLKIRQKIRLVIFSNLLNMIYLNLLLDKDHILTKIL